MMISLKSTVMALLLGVLASTSAYAMQDSFRHRMGHQTDGNSRFPRQRLFRRNPQPATLPAGARLMQNVAYGGDPAQRMDVYIPANAHGAPVLFMVHGGGWQIGDKANPNVVQNKIDYFLPKGFIFVSTNYRMVPQVGVMTEADDVAHALAYAQQHAAEWGGDPSKFVLMGHSAGAHLVVLLSSVPSIWQSAGAKAWLGTVALDSAAYNVVDIMNDSGHLALYDQAFGQNRQLWQEASPTLRLQSAPPPMLLVCNSRRSNSCDQAHAYADKAQSLGGHAKVFQIAMSHREINMDIGLTGSLTDQVQQFLQARGLP